MENGKFYGKLNFRIKASIFNSDDHDNNNYNRNVFNHRAMIWSIWAALETVPEYLSMTREIRSCSGSGATSCCALPYAFWGKENRRTKASSSGS
jgi:hypothetical protein